MSPRCSHPDLTYPTVRSVPGVRYSLRDLLGRAVREVPADLLLPRFPLALLVPEIQMALLVLEFQMARADLGLQLDPSVPQDPMVLGAQRFPLVAAAPVALEARMVRLALRFPLAPPALNFP